MAADYRKLERDLTLAAFAARAAVAAYTGPNGCGVLDRPVLTGIRMSAGVRGAFAAAGLRPYTGAPKGIHVGGVPGCTFQGAQRTLGAEAFAEYMNANGYEAEVTYVMD